MGFFQRSNRISLSSQNVASLKALRNRNMAAYQAKLRELNAAKFNIRNIERRMADLQKQAMAANRQLANRAFQRQLQNQKQAQLNARRAAVASGNVGFGQVFQKMGQSAQRKAQRVGYAVSSRASNAARAAQSTLGARARNFGRGVSYATGKARNATVGAAQAAARGVGQAAMATGAAVYRGAQATGQYAKRHLVPMTEARMNAKIKNMEQKRNNQNRVQRLLTEQHVSQLKNQLNMQKKQLKNYRNKNIARPIVEKWKGYTRNRAVPSMTMSAPGGLQSHPISVNSYGRNRVFQKAYSAPM